jgi:hypothetical protein
MKKNVFTFSIILHLLFSFTAFGQVLDKMQVKTVSKNLIVADKGKSQGIQVNTVYNINREGQNIGKAKVLLIEDNLCGLKILQLQPGIFVKFGDTLIKNPTDNSIKHKRGYIYKPPRFKLCFNELSVQDSKVQS